MSLQSSHQDSSLEEDRPSFSHLPTRSGTIQTKKDLAMTYQNEEKYTVTVSGQFPRTPSGSMYPEHKTKDYDCGRQGLIHLGLPRT